MNHMTSCVSHFLFLLDFFEKKKKTRSLNIHNSIQSQLLSATTLPVSLCLACAEAPRLGCDPAEQQDQTSQDQTNQHRDAAPVWPYPPALPMPQKRRASELRRLQSRHVRLGQQEDGRKCKNWSSKAAVKACCPRDVGSSTAAEHTELTAHFAEVQLAG